MAAFLICALLMIELAILLGSPSLLGGILALPEEYQANDNDPKNNCGIESSNDKKGNTCCKLIVGNSTVEQCATCESFIYKSCVNSLLTAVILCGVAFFFQIFHCLLDKYNCEWVECPSGCLPPQPAGNWLWSNSWIFRPARDWYDYYSNLLFLWDLVISLIVGSLTAWSASLIQQHCTQQCVFNGLPSCPISVTSFNFIITIAVQACIYPMIYVVRMIYTSYEMIVKVTNLLVFCAMYPTNTIINFLAYPEVDDEKDGTLHGRKYVLNRGYFNVSLFATVFLSIADVALDGVYLIAVSFHSPVLHLCAIIFFISPFALGLLIYFSSAPFLFWENANFNEVPLYLRPVVGLLLWLFRPFAVYFYLSKKIVAWTAARIRKCWHYFFVTVWDHGRNIATDTPSLVETEPFLAIPLILFALLAEFFVCITGACILIILPAVFFMFYVIALIVSAALFIIALHTRLPLLSTTLSCWINTLTEWCFIYDLQRYASWSDKVAFLSPILPVPVHANFYQPRKLIRFKNDIDLAAWAALGFFLQIVTEDVPHAIIQILNNQHQGWDTIAYISTTLSIFMIFRITYISFFQIYRSKLPAIAAVIFLKYKDDTLLPLLENDSRDTSTVQ